MPKMYYLFSKEERFEAVYVCDDGKYIDAATLQTGVYPFGSILSKAVKMLTPCLDKNHSPFLWENELLDEFSRFSAQSPSFSDAVSDDVSVQTVLRLLLIDRKYIIPDEKFDRLFELLQSYMGYIHLCQGNKEFCTFDKLNLIVTRNGHELPDRSIYAAKSENQTNALSKNEIHNLLGQYTSPKYPHEFAPSLKKQRTSLGKLRLPSATVKITTQKKKIAPMSKNLSSINLVPEKELRLKEPIYVFDIHDIVDLLLASLQCIFEEGYIIRKCFYCGDLFVIHRANQRYCPTSVYTTESKNCYQLAKAQRQLEKEKSRSAKMHKSLRNMYLDRVESFNDDDENYRNYKNYMEESQEWRDRIRRKEETEEHYAMWLETQYKRKYREKNTAAET